MSCEYCTGFTKLLGGPFADDHYNHAPSIQALQKSADDGCQLCALIIGEFEHTGELQYMLEDSNDGYPTVVQFVGRTAEGLLHYQQNPFWRELTGLQVYCGADGRNDQWSCSLCLYTQPDDESARSNIIAGRSVEQNSGSEKSLDLLRDWEYECRTNHPGCNLQFTDVALSSDYTNHQAEPEEAPPSKGPKLPSRVVKVDEQRPRLYVAEDGEIEKYLTLSHCWGKTQPFITVKETFAAREAGFDLEDLPKTFRDAITVTRKLGYQYIWIDSICIIQDDSRDWQIESAKMAQIYQNSCLTIAATASPDGSKGCFFDRGPDHAIEIRYTPRALSDTDTSQATSAHFESLQLSGSGGEAIETATFRACFVGIYVVDPLRKSPLNSRGWVVQERMLSRRLIHFASDQLFWECQTVFRSEGGEYNRIIPDHIHDRLTQNLRILEFFGPEPHRGHPAFSWDASLLGRWLQLVMQFSQKQLTKEMDVFPALAGVASLMKQRLGEAFCAGSWRSTLHLELLWVAFDAPHTSPAQWRAPSWSWAALNGEVEYYSFKQWAGFQPAADILHVEAEWTSQAFSSPLRPSAHMVVRGFLEPVTYNPEPNDWRLQDIICYVLLPADQTIAATYSHSWAVFDRKPPPVERVFWCLGICVERTDHHYCLLLEQIGNQPDEYRRIGSGRLDLAPAKFGGGQMSTIKII
ncbi:HET-domain-containing protein [Mytilinidion resinicola]|uniref:HET-domain-containing protein n=1 Tax=Mytilinidion resinicola TaxID=574789 RepID=A0A6A6YVH0_9PEZI|nr:HET-domain-containing protein [Mytilinidion resinicola]KAF2812942.1 HET-domain-containing protein [Mytilinidion resinicola]